MYQYGFRNYDPALGRWMNIDPLAEKFISQSPYAYVNNAPHGYAYFDGKDYLIDIVRDKKGNITGINISGTVYIQGQGASKKRAGELNSFAKKNLESKTVDGITIGVSMNYAYDESKNEKNLKIGENILSFDSAPEDSDNISHVNAAEQRNKAGRLMFLAGKTGTVFDSGKDNNTVFHETLHLLGLSDRYQDDRDKKFIPEELRGTTPHKGYEKNVMGDASYTNLNKAQYRAWMQHALTRAKSSTDRIIGTLQADKKLKTGL